MSLERAVGTSLFSALALSTTVAYLRHEEEFARRQGLNGTELFHGSDALPV